MQLDDEDFGYIKKIITDKNAAIIKHLESLRSDAAEQIIQLRGINAKLDKMTKNMKREIDIGKVARRIAYDDKFDGYDRHLVLALLDEKLRDRLDNSHLWTDRDIIEDVLIRLRMREKEKKNEG